ncbi:uncharacterized protein EDB91DRAFT_1077762 [Suillus paluster]|uniref:uncharacterized protein n=1 Tax=Suillus paluster TaxID=48578 RepID=UPI001B8706E0|nr:uncharacterized protein EDB91DRAFT_1077762 [Suillus paluster]KAG1752332.1 hypothetical protein EDB91DRAFT_1077762 [Suillus paluster]
MCIVLYYPPFAHTTNLKMFCASVLWPLADCSCKWSKAVLQFYSSAHSHKWFFTGGALSILIDSAPFSDLGHVIDTPQGLDALNCGYWGSLSWPSMSPGTGCLDCFSAVLACFFQFSSRRQFNIEDHTDLHYSFGGLHLLCLPPFLNKFNPSSTQMYYPLWAFSGHVMLKSLPNF